MNDQTKSFSPALGLAVVLVCASVGVATAIAPVAGALVPLALLILFGLTRLKRPALILFIAFLVIQDPLLFFVGGPDSGAGYIIKRLDELFLFLMAAWILVTNRTAQRSIGATKLGVCIACTFLAMGVSTVLRGVHWQPSLMDMLLFSKPFLLFALGASVVTERDELRNGLRIALPLMLGVVVFAVVFLVAPSLQESYLGDMRDIDQRLGMNSAQGFFDGPGPYSWFCAATFAVAYAAYLSFGKNRYLYSAITAATFAVLSWRRKSIGGIVAMVLIATLIKAGRDSASRRRAVAVLVLGIVLGISILTPIVVSLWQYTVHEYGGDPNSIARVALHYTSFLIAKDYFPFGTGFGTFGSYASSVYYSEVYAQYGLTEVWGLTPDHPAFITDTFWPMVMGQGGIAGLVPYVAFFVILLRTTWRAARSSASNDEDRFLSAFTLFVLVASLLESTSSHIYDTSMQSAFVMIPAGMAWTRFRTRAA
ncbi:MAG TPA: hypothetical protein VFV19_04360 [Candidatus Polarisedimenticolaceae bacterium]|nr:hypothetical protein [Candidatus Polarisedimenticolaceae bacterium]